MYGTKKQKTFAQIYDCYTTAGAMLKTAFFSGLIGLGGMITGALSTHMMGDEASEGSAVEQRVIDQYNKSFADIKHREDNIVKLKRVADGAEMDIAMGIGVDIAKQRFEKAKAHIDREEKTFSTLFDAVSRQLVTDQRVGEDKYDNLIKSFDAAATTPLPQYLMRHNSENHLVVTGYDSSLRECQGQFSNAPAKAEDIIACTVDRTAEIRMNYGFTIPAAISLIGFWGAPLLRRRRKEEEAAAAEGDSKTQTLKITYTQPKK